MEKENKLYTILKKIKLFSSLYSNSLNILVNKIKIRLYKKGEYICSEGEPSDKMYIILSGTVRVLKKGKGNSQIDITKLKSGSIAGIMSLFEKKKRSATLIALGNVKVGELEYKIFQGLIDKQPDISKALITVLSNYLRKETNKIAELISFEEDERIQIAIFDSKPYIEQILKDQNNDRFVYKFFKPRLNYDTISLASGFKVICVFVNDKIDSEVVKELYQRGVELIALRCAGYNNVDIEACKNYGISVVRVPAYSPYAVAEHTIALIMALNRHIHKANNRIREGNFSLDGLVGFDMYGKTVGIIGTGKIGLCLINILIGFGCKILAYDKYPNKAINQMKSVQYVTLENLFKNSDIISLHVPLIPETYHMINKKSISKMKKGVMLINTSRGGLVNTYDLIENLKTGQIGSAGLDVYEEESEYFFEDYSHTIISDDLLARLTTFNNVMVTSHMAFLTKEALENIVKTTLDSIIEFDKGKRGPQLTNSIY